MSNLITDDNSAWIIQYAKDKRFDKKLDTAMDRIKRYGVYNKYSAIEVLKDCGITAGLQNEIENLVRKGSEYQFLSIPFPL